MKTGGRILIIVAAGLAVMLLFLLLVPYPRGKKEEPFPSQEPTPPPSPAPGRTNASRPTQPLKDGFEGLNEAERSELKGKFSAEFRPELERWCSVYAGHVPFRPDAIAPENFHARMGRSSSYYCYVFTLNGMTIAIEDRNGVANVSHINTPQTAKLMDLPKGEAPDLRSPLTREEVTQLIKADSGKDFPPSEIRMVPTAMGSAMQGGVNVMVGGDPQNAASWEYTLTFGPDKMLTYYLKGNYVQGKAL